MHKSTTLRGWRKIGLIAGSIAVLTAGAGAAATQAFADPGSSGNKSAAGSAPTSKSHGPKAHQGHHAKANKASAGSGAAEKLSGAIAEVVPGTASDLTNTHQEYYGDVEQWGSLEFAPADGSPAGRVAVAYLNANQVKLYPRGDRDVTECFGDMEDCQVTTLPDGSTLRTHAIRMDLDELGTWEILLADRLVGDTVVHFVADAARDEATGAVTAERAPLTLEQLTEVASQPVWAS